MKPLRPAVFSHSSLDSFSWEDCRNGKEFIEHVFSIASSFPSLLLAFSAHPGLKDVAEKIAGEFIKSGINVFLSKISLPLSALSLSLVKRSMPLGLYLSEGSDGSYQLLALAGHGGPIDIGDNEIGKTSKIACSGVIGETDMLGPYVEQIAGLLDFFNTDGPGLSHLESPFGALEEEMRKNHSFRILSRRDVNGPKAIIDPTGESLQVITKDGIKISTPSIVETIGKYLVGIRLSNGTIIGPEGTTSIVKGWGTPYEVSGDSLNMSHLATFSDLLIGWWEPGIVAHQGHSPFGDAYLTLAYLLEAWANDESGE